MEKVFNVNENVNPTFYPVWNTEKPFNILKGGRSSFKSSVVALLLVNMMVQQFSQGKKGNIVVLRKVANTIRDSVFLKIQWAIGKYHLSDQFHVTVAPFKVQHKATGSTFFFYGQDDFEKLKSNDIGNILAVWYEEATEFKSSEEFDQTNITFMRQKAPNVDMVRFFWTYNPPKNPYSWINEWVAKLQHTKNYLIHSSSYLDDRLGFVDQQMYDEIKRIQENDYDYYRYLYLGEPVGLGTNVYNFDSFKVIDELPNERLVTLYFSIDTGHQVSATSCGAYVVTNKGNVIKIDTWYYSPAGRVKKKAPSELASDLHEFMMKIKEEFRLDVRNITVDSAEGGLRNQFDLDYNVILHPVSKKKKHIMIDYTHDLLANGRFYVLSQKGEKARVEFSRNNDIFLDECKKYQWDERTLRTETPNVVKIDDHSVDEFQYFCVDNALELGLDV